jgi:AcrR family transcriptional regulator
MRKEKASDAGIGAKNKQKILTAAEKAFAMNGFKGTSIQQIADSAGLPKTNILYYFKSKQGLYLALLQRIMHLWNSRFDQATVDDDPAQTIAEYITDKMEMSRTHPQVSRIFAMEILNGAPNFSTYFNEDHLLWMQGRKAIIDGWIESGKMAPIDPQYLLFNIWACTQHYADFSAQITNLRGAAMNKSDYQKATRELIALILRGCGLVVPEKFKE